MIWRRKTAESDHKQVSVRKYFENQIPVLQAQLEGAKARARGQHGEGYGSAKEAFEASLPAFLALERAFAQISANEWIAIKMSQRSDFDPRALRQLIQLLDEARYQLNNMQQSLGLLLFYPELNGHLGGIPVPWADAFQDAIDIAKDAGKKFAEWWQAHRVEYYEEVTNFSGAQELAFLEFTGATGIAVERPV